MDTIESKRLIEFFGRFKYRKSEKPLATTATTATKPESSMTTGSSPSSRVATKVATTATKPLDEYLAYLNSWIGDKNVDLPVAPPFPDRPERPIAWAAWWDAVEMCRKKG